MGKIRKSLRLCLLPILAAFFGPARAPAAQEARTEEKWYKGNLHMHTLWSDGREFPEMAIEWYKERGYHFVSVSDHWVIQRLGRNWKEVGAQRLTREMFDQYVGRFGEGWVESRRNGEKTEVRLKTFNEFIEKMNVPGEFLVIPGMEQTTNNNSLPGGQWVHMNTINVVDTMPLLVGPTVAETLRRNAAALARYGAKTGRETLFIANHPRRWYFDIQPQDLIDNPEVRFCDVLVPGPTFLGDPHPAFYTHEKFWDIVNAFRIEDGWPPLYGLMSCDRHSYPSDPATPLLFIMVRARELTAESLLRAIHWGDVYMSNGALLEKLDFNPKSRTLSVKVKSAPGVKYSIRFNGTKKGFDRSITTVDDPESEPSPGRKKPARTIPVYSDGIGQVFSKVEGTEASYTLADDDLYVRATVVSDKKYQFSVYPALTRESAWTQPYFVDMSEPPTFRVGPDLRSGR